MSKERKYTQDDIKAFKKDPKCPIHLFGGTDEEFIREMKAQNWQSPNKNEPPLAEADTDPGFTRPKRITQKYPVIKGSSQSHNVSTGYQAQSVGTSFLKDKTVWQIINPATGVIRCTFCGYTDYIRNNKFPDNCLACKRKSVNTNMP